MTKIIDKILAHRQQQEANRSETSNGAKLYYSLEFFPPKTKAGLDNLLTRIQRMSRCIDPLFVDVTWGASGSTADKTLAVASHVQNHCGVDVLLHLTTTGMSRERLIQTLDHAKKQGIQNILALRGDPPKGQRRWHVGDTSDGFCPRAIDLVRFIREEYGDYFGVAVVSKI
jgi:methylenetetrahydrofolate reductase (NADPH)